LEPEADLEKPLGAPPDPPPLTEEPKAGVPSFAAPVKLLPLEPNEDLEKPLGAPPDPPPLPEELKAGVPPFAAPVKPLRKQYRNTINGLLVGLHTSA